MKCFGARHYNVVCDGNSLTAGVGASSPAKSYPSQLAAELGSNYIVRNQGISGQTTLQMVTAFASPGHPGPLYNATDVNVLIAWEFTNDIYHGNVTTAAAMNHWFQYAELAAKTRYPMIALNCLPSTIYSTGQNAIRLACNAQLAANVASEFGIVVIDAAAICPNPSSPDYADGLHLSDIGYAKVTAAIKTAMFRFAFA